MEWMPVRFYCHRYQNLWEAEAPLGCDAHLIKTAILFMNRSSGPIFTAVTYTRDDWEKHVYEEQVMPVRKTWDEVAKYHVFLPEDPRERKPQIDREHWNEELQQTWKARDWRFRGKDFLIMIVQHRAEKKNLAHDAVVDKFVATLRLIGE